MLHYTYAFGLIVCGRTLSELNRWVRIFRKLLGYFSQVDGFGGWPSPDVFYRVEFEPNATLIKWFDNPLNVTNPVNNPWSDISRIIKYAKWYAYAGRQEAISFYVIVDGKVNFFVVPNDPVEWAKFEEACHRLFDDNYRFEKTTLAYFTRSK